MVHLLASERVRCTCLRGHDERETSRINLDFICEVRSLYHRIADHWSCRDLRRTLLQELLGLTQAHRRAETINGEERRGRTCQSLKRLLSLSEFEHVDARCPF